MSSTYPSLREYFLIGKALKSHGTSGQLRIMIEDQFKGYIREGSFLFFEHDGNKVPYKVINKEDGAHFVVSLDDIPNKKESDKLSGLALWIPLETVKPRHQRSPRNIKDKWNEYRIVNEESSAVYDIIRVEEFPQQLMAVIKIENKEILIPLSDQLISSIDKDNKMIRMIIPEGLMDL